MTLVAWNARFALRDELCTSVGASVRRKKAPTAAVRARPKQMEIPEAQESEWRLVPQNERLAKASGRRDAKPPRRRRRAS